MNALAKGLTQKAKWALSAVIALFLLLPLLVPNISLAKEPANAGQEANDECQQTGQTCWTRVGVVPIWGVCDAKLVCRATNTSSITGSILQIGAGMSLSQMWGRVLNTTPPVTTGPVPNPGPNICTRTRYATPDVSKLSDPCAYYAPPKQTTTDTGSCDSVSRALGLCSGTQGGAGGTTPGNDTTDATLTAAPTSGTAPLAVTFTAIDTSPTCVRSPITLSVGDGTPAVAAFSATRTCGSSNQTSAEFRPYTYRTAGTYTATVANQATGRTLKTVTISVSAPTRGSDTSAASETDTTSATLTATPTSGTAPLAVTFTVTDTSPTCVRSPIALSTGDGTVSVTAFSATTVCNSTSRSPLEFRPYTYRTAGTYQATIVNRTSGRTLQTVAISVAAPTQSTSGTSQTTTSQTGSNTSSSQSESTVVQRASQSTSQNANPPINTKIQSGADGDITVTSTGATIRGIIVDGTKNRAVAGFFGAKTINAGAPQTLAQRMCIVRPWQSPSLSAFLTGALFDEICSVNELRIGLSLATTTKASTANATTTQRTSPSAKNPAVGTNVPKAQPPATTTPVRRLNPAVAIKALPQTVPIGGRTTIYWKSQGVSTCTVTSPDGSFSGRGISGEGTTVPIVAPTVFSVSCIAPDGSHVTGFVTVNLAI